MVSIILPNLNTSLPFLEARLITIFNQSFEGWECIVIDGYSDNGSWEFIEQATQGDNRFKLYQRPRKGIYDAWNEGLKLATGKYIYIAPSDDTMHETLLEKMVIGLEKYSDCSIGHCCLKIIDEQGKKSTQKNWDSFNNLRHIGNEVSRMHIRYAPLDGILYCNAGPVYCSFTQLLINKKVFDKVGYFLTDQGSTADVEWCIRATFVFNTLHIPEYLATWRIHSNQATNDSNLNSSSLLKKFAYFVKHAVEYDKTSALLSMPFSVKQLQSNYLVKAYQANIRESESVIVKLRYVLLLFYKYPFRSLKSLIDKVFRLDKISQSEFINRQIKTYSLEKNIQFLT